MPKHFHPKQPNVTHGWTQPMSISDSTYRLSHAQLYSLFTKIEAPNKITVSFASCHFDKFFEK